MNSAKNGFVMKNVFFSISTVDLQTLFTLKLRVACIFANRRINQLWFFHFIFVDADAFPTVFSTCFSNISTEFLSLRSTACQCSQNQTHASFHKQQKILYANVFGTLRRITFSKTFFNDVFLETPFIAHTKF